jgi:hypothetical protein
MPPPDPFGDAPLVQAWRDMGGARTVVGGSVGRHLLSGLGSDVDECPMETRGEGRGRRGNTAFDTAIMRTGYQRVDQSKRRWDCGDIHGRQVGSGLRFAGRPFCGSGPPALTVAEGHGERVDGFLPGHLHRDRCGCGGCAAWRAEASAANASGEGDEKQEWHAHGLDDEPPGPGCRFTQEAWRSTPLRNGWADDVDVRTWAIPRQGCLTGRVSLGMWRRARCGEHGGHLGRFHRLDERTDGF